MNSQFEKFALSLVLASALRGAPPATPVASLQPPVLEPPVVTQPLAGADIVRGTTGSSKYLVRVKVTGRSGITQSGLGIVDQDGKFRVPLDRKLLEGEVVQAFLEVNGKAIEPSDLKFVVADEGGGATAVPALASGSGATPVTALAMVASPPVASSAVPASTMSVAAPRAASPAPVREVAAPVTPPAAANGAPGSAAVQFDAISLSARPKEGQKVVYVNASPTGESKYSLAVFVNGEQVRVIDGGNETDSVATSSTGATNIELKDPLDGGQCVQVVEFETGKRLPVLLSQTDILGCGKAGTAVADYSVSKSVATTAFFDYGRIRSYFVAGSLLSYNDGNFSQPSVFLAFNGNRNWLWGGTGDNGKLRRLMLDTFFEARLTTLPTVACTAMAGTSCPTPTTPTVQTVLNSAKAAELLGGVTVPVILTSWKRDVDDYGFTVGPIAKVGFLTPVSSQNTSTTQTVSPQSFYTNFGFGTRLGFQKLTHSRDVAPETISYIDVVSGRYANFDYNPDPTKRYARPWRFGFEGLLKLPSTPFFIGFSANVHQNFGLGGARTVDNVRDDLRFLFGAKFDAGKLFGAIQQIK